MFAIYYSGEPDTVRSPKAWHLHNARRDHKPKIKSIGSNGKYRFLLLTSATAIWQKQAIY